MGANPLSMEDQCRGEQLLQKHVAD